MSSTGAEETPALNISGDVSLEAMPPLAYQIPFDWGNLRVSQRAGVVYELIPRVPVEEVSYDRELKNKQRDGSRPWVNIFVAEPETAQQLVDALHPEKAMNLRGMLFLDCRDNHVDGVLSFGTSVNDSTEIQAAYMKEHFGVKWNKSWDDRLRLPGGFSDVFAHIMRLSATHVSSTALKTPGQP